MLLHKRLQISANQQSLTTSLVPSRGPIGSFVKILGQLYVRGTNRGFIKLPEVLSSHMIQQLEHRNATVQRARYALAIVAGLVIGALIYSLRGAL